MTLSKFQVTVLSVARRHAVMLCILVLFPFLAGLRVRDGTLVPYTDWFRLLGSALVLPGLYLSTLVLVALLQDAADASRERAGNLVFEGAIGGRLLLLAVVTLAVATSVGTYHQDGRFTMLGLILPVSMGLVALYCWPRKIEFSGGTLLQRKVLSGVKSIPFSDIIAARFDAHQQCILISGKNGATIVHSPLHAGRRQFARQVKLLAGADIFGLTV